MAETPDVHSMDPAEFWDRARSFESWFDSVQGYLDGLTYGHRPETAEATLGEAERDRLVTVLCNYCLGETIALEGAGSLIEVAPNRPSKVFLATQVADEGRHLEVLAHRLLELGVADPEAEIERRATPALVEFKGRLLELIRGHDWDAAVFAQNVILESMEFAAFHRHAQTADPRTAEILHGIVKDERRHIGFGENELGRRLQAHPENRARIAKVREALDPLVLRTFEETSREVGEDASERAELGRSYLAAIQRLGFA